MEHITSTHDIMTRRALPRPAQSSRPTRSDRFAAAHRDSSRFSLTTRLCATDCAAPTFVATTCLRSSSYPAPRRQAAPFLANSCRQVSSHRVNSTGCVAIFPLAPQRHAMSSVVTPHHIDNSSCYESPHCDEPIFPRAFLACSLRPANPHRPASLRLDGASSTLSLLAPATSHHETDQVLSSQGDYMNKHN